MRTIAIYHLKGGVGKTSATINLAVLAAAEGKRTLIWDLDPQGSASFYLESVAAKKNLSRKSIAGDIELGQAIQPTDYENLWIVPADLSAGEVDVALNENKRNKSMLASQLKAIKDEFDYVFLDCPPGLSLLHSNVFRAADVVLIPVIPSTLSLRAYEAVLDSFATNKLDASKVKAFFSMVDLRKIMHTQTIEDWKKNKSFFKTIIPFASDVEKMGLHQAPLASFAPNSTAAVAYYQLWKELEKKI